MYNRNKIIMLFIVAFITILGLASINIPTPSNNPESIIIQDALNRSIQINLPISKIIIAGKANGLIVSAAYFFPEAITVLDGLSDSIEETNILSYVDPNIQSKVVLTDRFDVEQIAALTPDVVLLKTYMKDEVGDSLETLGISVLYIDFEDLSSYIRDLSILGTIFDNEEKAESIVNYYETKYNEILEDTQIIPLDVRPKVMLLYYNAKGGTISFMTPGPYWLQTTMISVAGGYPLSSELTGSGWNIISFEQIAAWDPEILFIVSYSNNPSPSDVKDMLMNDTMWNSISAIKERQIYAFPDDCGNQGGMGSWDSPGSRWILGLEWMTYKINKTSYDIDIVKEAEEFYSLYNLNSTSVLQIINDISGDFN